MTQGQLDARLTRLAQEVVKLNATNAQLLTALEAIDFAISDGWLSPEGFIIPDSDEDADSLLIANATGIAAWYQVRRAIAAAKGAA